MTRPRAAIVAFGLVVAGALAACGGGSGTGAAATEGPGAAPPETAPRPTAPAGTVGDVAFERFDGSPASLAEYAGRPLVVNFFAAWCAPCVRELPAVEEVHQALGDQVTVLGLSVSERAEDGRRLADQTGLTFDLGRDPRSEALKAVGGAAMPTTVFVDAEGHVVHARSLPYDDAAQLEADVREHLLS
jgi:thiol-disulfide isomerase/thioredoxin